MLFTSTPAKIIGKKNSKGTIAIGFDADLLVLDENYNIDIVVANGKLGYKDHKAIIKDLFS